MWDKRTNIKSEADIEKIRASAHIVAETIEHLRPLVVPGALTSDLNAKAEAFIESHNARPAFKNYKVGRLKFQYSTCMSKNNVVVHGFPDDVPLKEGDLISVDVGVEKDGWFGDSAYTFGVG